MITGRGAHRFGLRKTVIASVALLTTGLASVAIGFPAAEASDGTNAAFGTWKWSRFTEAQADPNPPTDPDGESGEGNLANVIQIGERYERQIPGTEYQSSDWVRHTSQGDGWVQLPGADGEKWVEDTAAYDETVEDTAAWTETVEEEAAHWQRYSWTGGPVEEGHTPSFPSSDWQPNVQGDPHDVGHAGAYFRSNGGSGNGDWFYLEWVGAVTRTVTHPATTHVVHHPAAAHREFRYERLVPAHTEYYWSVYERTNTRTEPNVEEPTDPADPADPSDPTVGSRANPVGSSNAPSGPSASSQPSRAGAHSRAVPVSIDAGL